MRKMRVRETRAGDTGEVGPSWVCLFHSPDSREQIWGHRIHSVPCKAVPIPSLHQPTWAYSPGWHHSRSPSAAEAGPAAPAQGLPGASGKELPAGICEHHPGGPSDTGHQPPRGSKSHPLHPSLLTAWPAGTHRRHPYGEGDSVWDRPFLRALTEVRPQVNLVPIHAHSLGNPFPNEIQREDS